MKPLWLMAFAWALACGQDKPEAVNVRSTYALGPGDKILVRVLDMEEMSKEPYQIDMKGNISLPMAGRLRADALTVEQLEELIASRLKTYIKSPEVSVSLLEMRSQPISVFGAVAQPGVHQLQGEKSLFEIISLVGGLKPEAGYSIKITRRKEWGAIPLPGCAIDASGEYYVAEVNVGAIMNARSPALNIMVKPHDIISVPKGELVYVMGAVKKNGGFVLGEKERVTVLQALSMAEGFDAFAKKGSAKILRKTDTPEQRLEIAVNLGKILDGKVKDVFMQSEDILYIPASTSRRVAVRAAEVAGGLASGVILYRTTYGKNQ